MKIVYFNYLYDSTRDSVGASVHVRQLVNALAGHGHEIRSFHLNKAPAKTVGRASARRRIRSYLKGHLRRYIGQLHQFIKNRRLFFKEWRILKSEKPDILLIRYNLLNFTAPIAAKLQGVPVVLEVNSPHAYERKHLTKDVWQLPLLPVLTERLNLRLADRIITVSQALKDFYVARKVISDKIYVVPNGVDVDSFARRTRGIKKTAGLANRTVLGFIGSFHYWHGMSDLLYLIEHTIDEYPQISYLLVGDGPMREEAEEFVRAHGYQDRVLLTGYVRHEDIPKYVASMDIALAPYPYMDFFYFSPLKLFEYMAAGRAAIASDIGQISEIIRHRENGLLYQPGDPDKLVECASELIEQPGLRTKLGKRGRATVMDQFTWKRNADNILKVIGTLNGRANGRPDRVAPQPMTD